MTAYATLAARTIRERVELDEVRRASLDAWIKDCDRVLDALERSNRKGATELSQQAREQLVALAVRLTELGADPMRFWLFHMGRDNHVQRGVDYIFDVLQPLAFALKWPGLVEFLAAEGEEEAG